MKLSNMNLTDGIQTVCAYALVSVIVTAVLWLLSSAVASFIALDWRSVTETGTGRMVFAVLWLWLHVCMLRKDGE